MWVAFAVQKLLTFFQQIAFAVQKLLTFSAKNIRILCIESTKTVNEMTLSELIKLTTLWTTGPWVLFTYPTEPKIDCLVSLCTKKKKKSDNIR